jgi:spermidine synthase
MTLPRPRWTLYALSVIGSGCGFVTQMLVSGFWSTTFSQDVYYFSLNVAFYFLFLGLGSLMSSSWKEPTLELLFEIVCLLCLWTGLSIPFLRFIILRSGNLALFPILTVAVSGCLAGAIIPLTLRVGAADPRIRLSRLFFLDYSAAIAFTLLFTFVLLIPLGYGRTALVLSYTCLAVTAGLLVSNRVFSGVPVWVAGLALIAPVPAHLAARPRVAPKMAADGEAKILVSRQSHYQKIVLTEEDTNNSLFPGLKQHVLYLDGFVQFSSIDEQNYHICIVNIPAAAAEYQGHPVRKALVLGGGDGLAVRNLVAMPNLESVTLVELDPEMIDLSRNEPAVLVYNLNSLADPRVKVLTTDAFRWVKETKDQFDLIVIDFPAPKNLALSRLFSSEFYGEVKRLLKPSGFAAIQAGPSFSFDDPKYMTLSQVTSSVRRTVSSVGLNANIYVSARDEDAFVLATPDPKFEMKPFADKIGITTQQGMGFICAYNANWKEPPVQVNTLNTLVLSTYMLKWFRRAGGPFFNYSGQHAVFLPD